MSRRPDRIIVRRRPARAAGTSWIPWVLLIALLVIGGIVVYMLATGDDADAEVGLIALPLALQHIAGRTRLTARRRR